MSNLLLKIIYTCLIISLSFLMGNVCAQEISLEIVKQEISCFGEMDGQAGVIPTGGQSPYLYQWTNGETIQNLVNIGPGTYEVTVTDANGVTATSAAGLIEITPLEVELIVTDGTCGDLAKIETKVTGGLGPYQYNWSDESFSSDAKNLEEGDYSVTVTDRNACPIVLTETVVVHGEGLKLSPIIVSPTCTGRSDGYIIVNYSGGEQPVELAWSDGSTGLSIDNLTAGTYSVFGTDAFGCNDGLVIIVQDPDLLQVNIVSQNNSLYASVEGGTPSYEYTWSNGVTGSSVISNLSAGDYGLTVEDANGCTDEATSEVLSPLSSNSIEAIQSFSLYPTLVQSELQLSLDLDKAQMLSYKIYSSNGALINSYTSYNSKVNMNFPLISQLASGVYLLQISAESGWSFSEKFIKL